MLYLDVHVGDKIKLGDAIVTLMNKSGRTARVSVDADPSIKVNLLRDKSQRQDHKTKQ